MSALTQLQQKQLDGFTAAAGKFLALIEPLSEADLDLHETPVGWSIRQIVHHVSDDGDVWAFQMKRALTTPDAPLRFEGFPGNEAWAAALGFAERAIGPDLALIQAHNRAMTALAASFPAAWEQAVSLYNDRGEPAGCASVANMLAFLTEHLQEHTATVEKILEQRQNFAPLPSTDPFPASDFDQWAAAYDQEVTVDGFPFTGYEHVLDEVARQVQAAPGMRVLDLGTGTGNLAARFVTLGCELWCTDYSPKMLEIARAKLPAAHILQHDLRQPFPTELQCRFDAIVSAYVLHHLELPEKVAFIKKLLADCLAPGGRLVIADISFPTRQACETIYQAAGSCGDEEPYWIVSEALPVLAAAGIPVAYTQISNCAGIYRFGKNM